MIRSPIWTAWVPVPTSYLRRILSVECSVAGWLRAPQEDIKLQAQMLLLGIHNPTRHILDMQGPALEPCRERSPFHCFALCAQLATGNSFNTSSACFWGKVDWAHVWRGTRPVPRAPCKLSVQNLGLYHFIYKLLSRMPSHIWGRG